MEVQKTAGARGQVIDHGSRFPIAGAKICLKERQDICTSTDSFGNFELRPVTEKVWEFIMVEEFGIPGTFSITAPGYKSKEVYSYSGKPIEVELENE